MRYALVVGLAAAVPWLQASAQTPDPTAAEFDKFREIMEQDNPAELFEVKGEELWRARRGPKNASLEQCDLGLGPGVVKGAYAQLPRYFADVDRVMDAEARIVHCMITLQGFKYEELAKQPFSSLVRTPEPVSLVTYVAAQSRGMKIESPQNHPKERDAYETGKAIFHYRAGAFDFSCASCHGVDDKRIRTQPLPNFTKPATAIARGAGLAGLPHDRRRDAFAAVAPERLLPPAALPGARLRLGNAERAADLPHRQRQRPRLPRPGHQALGEPTP